MRAALPLAGATVAPMRAEAALIGAMRYLTRGEWYSIRAAVPQARAMTALIGAITAFAGSVAQWPGAGAGVAEAPKSTLGATSAPAVAWK
jgi:hypothetical protein